MNQTTIKNLLYLQAWCRTVKQNPDLDIAYKRNPDNESRHILKRIIYYGVKAVNTTPEPEHITREAAETNFQFISIIKDLMALLTPIEFMQMFPIEKDYKGHRWGFKDFFYTRDYINGLEQGKPIGGEILNFLWEYQNKDITEFNISSMEALSNLRKLDGLPSLAEEFADEMGLKTYTVHTDSKGREFLIDKDTGKTMRVKKSKPRYLKLVKGGKVSG
jgi:hypothetical protein